MGSRQLSYLHADSNGFFTIAKGGKYWKQQYFDDITDININLEDKDVYVSQNTFKNKSRRLVNLKELKALYIDIDCYTKNLSKKYVINYLEHNLYNEIPVPNMLIDSGRGLYYIILLENTKGEELPKWQLVENFLLKKLECLGADNKCIDATRVLRVIGSSNSKNNKTVKILNTLDYNYTLDEIIENFLPEILEPEIIKIKEKPRIVETDVTKQNKEKTKQQKPSIGVRKKDVNGNTVTTLFNLYTLYYNRLLDFETLAKIRNFKMEGYRETILFLYRHFSNIYFGNDYEALENVKAFNCTFSNPLTDKEVEEATRSASIEDTDRQYNYSNDKLIKVLQITTLEQQELNTIISKKEKYRRNNKQRYTKKRNQIGLTDKEVKINKLINDIKELKRKKYTNKQISDKLKLNERTIKRYLKK